VAQTNTASLFLLITVGFHNHYSDLRVGRWPQWVSVLW